MRTKNAGQNPARDLKALRRTFYQNLFESMSVSNNYFSVRRLHRSHSRALTKEEKVNKIFCQLNDGRLYALSMSGMDIGRLCCSCFCVLMPVERAQRNDALDYFVCGSLVRQR